VTGSIHVPTVSDYLPITPEEIADGAGPSRFARQRAKISASSLPRADRGASGAEARCKIVSRSSSSRIGPGGPTA
jgi:hypothetical protein